MLIDVCAENDLIVGNTWFRKRSINKYIWLRNNGRDRALLDYVLVRKDMKGSLKDVHVFRGVADGMSDYFLVETKMSLPRTWDRKSGSKRKSVIKYEKLKEETVKKRA